MNNDRVCELISENLPAIYGYAYARLYDKDQVEELVSDIVYEILTSAEALREDAAFWGFAWRIAEYVLHRFIRRRQLLSRVESLPEEGACSVGVIDAVPSPAQEYAEREERDEKLYLLRRELSLLSRTHREVCVAYYVRNLSCREIAKEQNISVDMVKYHLFKTRKLLKEGIGMTRTLGEKSYNPGTFRMDFWGSENHYYNLFDRKLPGSIMLAAYHTPMRAEELSVELGVAMPYLEDELEILETAGVLKRIGERYQTSLVILTDDYEKKFVKETSPIYTEVADEIFATARALLPQIRALNFKGNNYDDNRLLIGLLNMAMMAAYCRCREQSPIGKAPTLPLGGHGWVFGYDNDYTNHHFHGITMETWNRAQTAWFSAENYRVFNSCQRYDHSHFLEKAEAVCAAVLEEWADTNNAQLPYLIENGFVTCVDGKLSANFLVFEMQTLQKVYELLSPITERVAVCMINISDRAEKILTDLVPASVKDQCVAIAKIHHRLDVAAFLMEDLIGKGKLAVPHGKVPVCMFGVKK